MGLQVQQETLAQYQGALLSPHHPTSRRVREEEGLFGGGEGQATLSRGGEKRKDIEWEVRIWDGYSADLMADAFAGVYH
jgi:hypothetical protein